MSVKFGDLTVKDIAQYFVLKPTTGTYYSLKKMGFWGAFCRLLNKAKIYECVEMKGNILNEGKVLGSY